MCEVAKSFRIGPLTLFPLVVPSPLHLRGRHISIIPIIAFSEAFASPGLAAPSPGEPGEGRALAQYGAQPLVVGGGAHSWAMSILGLNLTKQPGGLTAPILTNPSLP